MKHIVYVKEPFTADEVASIILKGEKIIDRPDVTPAQLRESALYYITAIQSLTMGVQALLENANHMEKTNPPGGGDKNE